MAKNNNNNKKNKYRGAHNISHFGLALYFIVYYSIVPVISIIGIIFFCWFRLFSIYILVKNKTHALQNHKNTKHSHTFTLLSFRLLDVYYVCVSKYRNAPTTSNDEQNNNNNNGNNKKERFC